MNREAGTRKRCPIHGIPDCSPLLNGCSQLTTLADGRCTSTRLSGARCSRDEGHSGAHYEDRGFVVVGWANDDDTAAISPVPSPLGGS